VPGGQSSSHVCNHGLLRDNLFADSWRYLSGFPGPRPVGQWVLHISLLASRCHETSTVGVRRAAGLITDTMGTRPGGWTTPSGNEDPHLGLSIPGSEAELR
jgi:hypothetical protein